jgi:DNA-binding beta-propeller fold protein YncE
VVKKIPLPGETGWDFLTADPQTKRLYITRGTHVSVLDADSGSFIGDIPADGAHGVAIAGDLGRGFSTNGKSNTVTVFNLADFKVLTLVKTGQKPDAIVYEPVSHRVFAFNGESKSATVIDAAKAEAVATVDLPGNPESAVTDPSGKIFVNIEDKNLIVAIDPVKASKLSQWPIPGCESPSGLALDAEHHRLFAGCENQKMVVIDAETGQWVASLPIGKGVDAAGFDPGGQFAFSSNGEGTLTAIHEDSPNQFKVVANVPTQKSARTLAVDPVSHRVYSVAAQFDPKKKSGPPGHQRPALIPGSVVLLVLEP